MDKKEERTMHRERTNQLGQLEHIDILMATTQFAKKMRSYLKMNVVEVRTMQVEDVKKIVINAFEMKMRRLWKPKKTRIKKLVGASNTNT